jgi:hypothetical protein
LVLARPSLARCDQRRRLRALRRPWIPPSTIAVIQENARTIEGDFRLVYQALPRWLAIMLLGLVWIKVMVRRLGLHFQFAIFFSYLMCVLTLMYAWAKISIVPQPIRYHLEMEMALSLVLAFTAMRFSSALPSGSRTRHGRLADPADQAHAPDPPLLARFPAPGHRHPENYGMENRPVAESETGAADVSWSPARPRSGSPRSPTHPSSRAASSKGTTNPIIRIALYGIYTGETAGTRDAEFSILG